MQVTSLGSLLNELPQDQLITYYHQQSQLPKKHQSQEQFIAVYQIRRARASEDAQELSKLGVTTAEIMAKINDIVLKAKPFFEDSLSWKKTTDKYHADVDQKFRVRGLDKREMTLSAEPCPMCHHNATGGITYTILNLRTQEEIKIHKLALHVLEHDYFGNPSHEYRINIDNVCKVLELGPYKNY